MDTVIERLTGQTAGEAITARIITPLGLTGTSYPTTPVTPAPSAHGYATGLDGAGIRDVTGSNPAVAAEAGAMISTPAELRTWARVLADGSLLSLATVRDG